MPQSSLTAWLQKPPAVTEDPKEASAPVETVTQLQKASVQEQLPTPPSSSQESPEHETNVETARATPDVPSSTQESGYGLQKPALPPNVDIRKCTKEDIPAFKRLNSLLLPIPYPESFYREILEDPLTSNITLLATWHDDPSNVGNEKGRLVGAIRCRLLAHPPGHSFTNGQDSSAEKPMLYLSTLVLLSPYRSHGIATHMLQRLTVKAVKEYGVGSIGAHVWEANAEGLEWYRKRGFKELRREEGYYRRLKPQGAVVVKRDIGVMDLMGG